MNERPQEINDIILEVQLAIRDKIIENPGVKPGRIVEKSLVEFIGILIYKQEQLENRINELETLLAEVDHASLSTH